MTLGELRKKVYEVIEELNPDLTSYTDDSDYEAKFNTCANIVQNELAKITDKVTREIIEVTEGEEIVLSEDLERFRLLKKITGVDFDIEDEYVTFKETGIATIYYYQRKKQIKEDTDDNFKLDFDDQTLDCMIYGVASEILKNDVSSNYGAYFTSRYNELKQQLDPRSSQGTFKFVGGVNV
jgi:hypothetical protein